MNRQINNPAVDGSPDLTFYQKKDNVCHTLLKVIKMYCCDCDKSIYANRQKESINTIDSGLTTRNKTFNEDSIAVSLFTNSRKGKRQLLSNSMCIVGQPRIHQKILQKRAWHNFWVRDGCWMQKSSFVWGFRVEGQQTTPYQFSPVQAARPQSLSDKNTLLKKSFQETFDHSWDTHWEQQS